MVIPRHGHLDQDWIVVVRLLEAVVVCVPPSQVLDLGERLTTLSCDEIVDPRVLGDAVGPFAQVLGPAVLAYTDARCFRRVHPDHRVRVRLPRHERLLGLMRACDPAEADESGVAEWTSPVFTIERTGAAIAASGYTVLSEALANVGVLVHPGWRGGGLARAVAGAAVAHAIARDLVPQWRARSALIASRRVAQSLGFVDLGTQLAARLTRLR